VALPGLTHLIGRGVAALRRFAAAAVQGIASVTALVWRHAEECLKHGSTEARAYGPVVRIAVAALKGGTGKTSTAVGLAETLAATGQQVVLVDTDPQGSAMRWSSAAAEDGKGGLRAVVVAIPTADLARRLPTVTATADAVVLDTPPGHVATVRAAITAAQVVVVPMAPTLLDLDRVSATLDLARDANRPAVILLNRTRARTRSLAGVREALDAAELPVLSVDVPQREAVATAWGLLVASELRQLYQPIIDELQGALANLNNRPSEEQP